MAHPPTVMPAKAGIHASPRWKAKPAVPMRYTVSADKWQADYLTLDKISETGAPANARAKFVVEKGKPGVSKA